MPSLSLQRFWVRARKDRDQRPIKKLRYYYRQLRKPTDVPEIRNSDIKLELYRRYGHPYTTFAEAMEAHVMCRTIGVAEGLSKLTYLPMKFCCFLVGVLVTLLVVISLEIAAIVAILTFTVIIPWVISKCAVGYSQQSFWRHERLVETWQLPMEIVRYYFDQEDSEELRAKFEIELSWTSFWNFLKQCCFLVVYIAVFTNAEWIILYAKRLYMEWRYKSGEVCAVCYTEKRTQCFQPCGHLVCCSSCADELLECPMCKEFIMREHTTTPVTPRAPDDVTGTPCEVCGAGDRTQSRRILVPCGHVIVCKDGCARLLDDCPVCWEEVTDDRNVYLP